MIEAVLEKWEALIQGKHGGDSNALLDDLLADDVVFLSPVVFTPQEGKAVTKLYLGAAGATFGGDGPAEGENAKSDKTQGGFRYIKKVVSGNQAVLEFETTMRGKYVNGVDIVTCNDEVAQRNGGGLQILLNERGDTLDASSGEVGQWHDVPLERGQFTSECSRSLCVFGRSLKDAAAQRTPLVHRAWNPPPV